MVAAINSFRLGSAFLLLIFLLPVDPIPVQGAEDGESVTVAEGSVGEPGMTSMLHHRVKGGRKKLLVLSTVTSSLCGNTGVVALLVVNGAPEVHGTLTQLESTIQVEATPGDRVIAIAHAIPLYNEIQCIRLGELKFELSERDAAN